MALLGGNAASAAQKPVAQATAEGQVADVSEKKAKKLEALKRFKERRAAQIQEQWKKDLALRDYLTQKGYINALPEDLKAHLADRCVDPKERKAASSGGAGGLPTILTQLYGDAVKVGDKINLEQAFQKTAKGKATLEILFRRWKKDSNIDIEIVPNANIMKTEFVVKTLPESK